MHRLALLLALSASAACATTDLIDPDEVVTIQQGLYGLTISGCDTTGCTVSAYENAPITVTAAGATSPLLTTTSDDEGFFELALPAGSYELCVHSCIDVTITEGQRVRLDFESGPGGGIWCDDTGCRPRD
jgi:hypothetical protein